jgi:diguanylate cyclase (GGDEF)-like protein/PAS domain S-box-containing protein
MARFGPTVEGQVRWQRAIWQTSTLLGLSMIGLVWGGLIFHIHRQSSNAERAAVQNSDSLARAFEEHLSRSLKDLDRSLKIIRSHYPRNPGELEFKSWLGETHLFDDQVVQVAIIAPDGLLALSSVDPGVSPRIDLSDREHFRVHRDARDDELFISKPVIGRSSGKWSIQLTRRIEGADRSFGGVVVASLDPMYLSRFYNSVDVPHDGYVSIVGTDAIVRAVSGHTVVPLGADVSPATLFHHYPEHATGWFYTASSFIDGNPRLVTYRALADYPLIVTVALSTTDLFAGVFAEWHLYSLIGVTLTLAILVIVGLSIRGCWIRERMARALVAQNRSLNQTRNFLDAIIENVPVPIVVKDPETRSLSFVNRAYEAFIGRQRHDIIGKTVFDLFPSDDAEEITRLDGEALEFNKQTIVRDFSVATPKSGRRVVNTSRLIVCGENQQPRHLIIVIEDITEKRKADEQIAYLAHHDPLTGLLNRVRFNQRLDQALTLAEQGDKLALFLLDLDRFKEVNDVHGHLIGDELLKCVADRLIRCVRAIDFVARLGGDEFVILQTKIESPHDILALADRIRLEIAAPYDIGDIQAAIGVSIGISRAPIDGTVASELLLRADVALYKAKADGRGTYRFFEPAMDAGVAA